MAPLTLLPALVLLPTLAPRPALAQERPQTLPTRDVDVTYSISRGGQALQERARWFVAQSLQRIDPPGQAIYMVMDHRTHRAEMIDDTRKLVLDLAAGAAPNPLDPSSGAQFTRREDAVIAGLPCTNWQTGPQTVLCLTADGVLLRLQAAGHTLVEAISVTYAPADPAAFAPPPDYQHATPPPK